MSTKESLSAQMHDFDRKILLNHSRQGDIAFVRNGTRDSALSMNALKSEMEGLQIGRAQIQAELIILRMLLVVPSSSNEKLLTGRWPRKIDLVSTFR